VYAADKGHVNVVESLLAGEEIGINIQNKVILYLINSFKCFMYVV